MKPIYRPKKAIPPKDIRTDNPEAHNTDYTGKHPAFRIPAELIKKESLSRLSFSLTKGAFFDESVVITYVDDKDSLKYQRDYFFEVLDTSATGASGKSCHTIIRLVKAPKSDLLVSYQFIGGQVVHQRDTLIKLLENVEDKKLNNIFYSQLLNRPHSFDVDIKHLHDAKDVTGRDEEMIALTRVSSALQNLADKTSIIDGSPVISHLDNNIHHLDVVKQEREDKLLTSTSKNIVGAINENRKKQIDDNASLTKALNDQGSHYKKVTDDLNSAIVQTNQNLDRKDKAVNKKVDDFIARKDNPHAVTKAQVGLGSVNDWGASSALDNASESTYTTTAAAKKLKDLIDSNVAADKVFRARTDNPHKVTQTQVGLSNVNNWGASSALDNASTSTYSTTAAAKQLKDLIDSNAKADATFRDRHDNPHGVTKAQVGLSNVPNYIASHDIANNSNETFATTSITHAVQANLTKHIGDYAKFIARTDNPHKVTQTQVGLSNVNNWGASSDINNNSTTTYATTSSTHTLLTSLNAHVANYNKFIARTDNPHKVTKAQVGLGNVPNYVASHDINNNSAEVFATTAITHTVQANLTNHISDFAKFVARRDNPHGVTKAQVGLSNVPNFTATGSLTDGSASKFLTADAGKALKTLIDGNQGKITETIDKRFKALLGGVLPAELDTLKEIVERLSQDGDVLVTLNKTIATKATIVSLNAHTGNKANPHGVTKAQVGLGSVNNWGATNSISDAATNKYSTAGAAKAAYDRGTLGITTANNAHAYADTGLLLRGNSPALSKDITKQGVYAVNNNSDASGGANHSGTLLHIQANPNRTQGWGQIYISHMGDLRIRSGYGKEDQGWSTAYTTNHKPNNTDVGLSNVPNYAFIHSVTDASATKFGSAGAIKLAYDRGTDGINKANAAQTTANSKMTQATGDDRYLPKMTPDHTTNANWYFPIWNNGEKDAYTSKSKLQFRPSDGRFKAVTFESNNWFRSTGDSGWYNETHGGGITMTDNTWLRVHGDKKFYVSNTGNDAISTAGGITAKRITFLSGASDSAYIGTTISGTSTHLDFSLSDDYNGNDKFRWLFTVSGESQRSQMELYPTALGANKAKLLLFGEMYAMDGTKRVYHTGYNPNKNAVGLGSVNNWGASSDINNNSTTTYATTAITHSLNATVTGNGNNYNKFIARRDNPHGVTKTQVGLGSVNNWGASSAVNSASDSVYASSHSVKIANDNANSRLNKAQGDSYYLGKTARANDTTHFMGRDVISFPVINGEISFGGDKSVIDSHTKFHALLAGLGVFNTKRWVGRGSWYYDGNNSIADSWTGCGTIPLAGSVVTVTNSNGGTYTVSIVTPTTAVVGSGFSPLTEYLYCYNGPAYSPTWRRLLNNTSQLSPGNITSGNITNPISMDHLTLNIGEGLIFESENSHFGKDLDARILTCRDANNAPTEKVDGGFVIRGGCGPDGHIIYEDWFTIQGRVNKAKLFGHDILTTANLPSKASLGLSNVPNWTATSAVNNASTTTFATAAAVKTTYDLAYGKLNNHGNNIYTGNLSVTGTEKNGNIGTPMVTLSIGDCDTGFNSAGDGALSCWVQNVKCYNMIDVYHPGNLPNTLVGTGGVMLGMGIDNGINFGVSRGDNLYMNYNPVSGAARTPSSLVWCDGKSKGGHGNIYASKFLADQGFLDNAGCVGVIPGYDNEVNFKSKYPLIYLNHRAYGTAITGIHIGNGDGNRATHGNLHCAQLVADKGINMYGGSLYISDDNVIQWARNTDSAKIGFKNTGDQDADSYMYFETGDNGTEYFKWSHRGSGAALSMDWMNLKSSGLVVTGDITAFSDIRVKANLEVIKNPLSKIHQLNGYTYDRTDMDVPRQTGLVAQELEKVLPEAVHTDKNVSLGIDDFKSVAYGNVVGLVVEAIKEMDTKFEKKLNDVTTKYDKLISKLMKRISDLETA